MRKRWTDRSPHPRGLQACRPSHTRPLRASDSARASRNACNRLYGAGPLAAAAARGANVFSTPANAFATFGPCTARATGGSASSVSANHPASATKPARGPCSTASATSTGTSPSATASNAPTAPAPSCRSRHAA